VLQIPEDAMDCVARCRRPDTIVDCVRTAEADRDCSREGICAGRVRGARGLIGSSTDVALNARDRGMGLGEKGEEGIEERNYLTMV
jgi:hypothetical protein